MAVTYKQTWFLLMLFGLILQSTVSCNSKRRHHGKHTIKDRIIDGVEVSEREYPEYATLEIPAPNNRVGICGGVLIQPDIVLTAAHCFIEVNEIQSINVSNSIAAPSTWSSHDRRLTRRVKAACASEKYHTHSQKSWYDYGVLVLEKKFDNFKIAKLAKKELKVGTTGIAVGMGMTHYDEKNPQNIVWAKSLRKLEMQVAECAEQNKHETHICFTSKSGGDICYGDSGSPVFSEDKKVLGFASYGSLNPPEICIHGFKARSVFSDIARNRKLIDKLAKDCQKKSKRP